MFLCSFTCRAMQQLDRRDRKQIANVINITIFLFLSTAPQCKQLHQPDRSRSPRVLYPAKPSSVMTHSSEAGIALPARLGFAHANQFVLQHINVNTYAPGWLDGNPSYGFPKRVVSRRVCFSQARKIVVDGRKNIRIVKLQQFFMCMNWDQLQFCHLRYCIN